MNNLIEDQVILEHISKFSVLCIDDNKTTQLLYDAILEDMFKHVIFAYDGNEGYQKYIDNEIDIIITDYDMPNLNGLDMVEKIRAENKDIPIILVSAIEDIDIVSRAIQLNINNFIRKPVKKEKVQEAIIKVSKLIIANVFLEQQREAKLKELRDKEAYSKYQEDLGFAKELNIIKNDFYYKMLDSTGIYLLDFLYHPLDVMSGDAYCARRINDHKTFYLMVDGMGKGVSASLTAMIMTSFVNHIFDKMFFINNFDFTLLIRETMEYIKSVLLDEESLSIDYIVIDNKEEILHYAKFAMPVLLMENSNQEIVRVKSNNPPMSKYQDSFNTASLDISDIQKFLIYSDGIVENHTIYEDKTYADFIEEDFLNSFTKEDIKNSFYEKINIPEDDITLIYINKLEGKYTSISNKEFSSTLDEVDGANDWYSGIWQDITDDTTISSHAAVSFTELFMNAYEHGNLGIDATTKNSLIDTDTYYNVLAEKEKICTKKITVNIYSLKHNKDEYIITQITDEGDGFDTHILSSIFRDSLRFNGRGVFMSRKNSSGIYYSNKGNSVLYLNKIEK